MTHHLSFEVSPPVESIGVSVESRTDVLLVSLRVK